MPGLKRKIYGLPIMRGYRLMRARQVARRPRLVREGFSLATFDDAFSDEWEREEREAVGKLLPECAALIDVGANNGFYSLLAAHLGRPAVAVEPDAGNLIVLRRNVEGQNVEVYPGALSDKPGMVNLYGDGDMASFDPAWQGVGQHFRQAVHATTLDALIADRWAGQRLFIKIDVEGAEHLVLRGSQKTLTRTPKPYWLIETFPNIPTGAANLAYAEVTQKMNNEGYRARPISSGNVLYG
jgi:FkbM family methyltransferase